MMDFRRNYCFEDSYATVLSFEKLVELYNKLGGTFGGRALVLVRHFR